MHTRIRQSYPLTAHRFDLQHLGPLPTLAANRLFGSTAVNIVGIFYPIFLYEFFGLSLQMMFAWFVVSYLIRIPMFVWGAQIFSRIGLKTSMFIATLGYIVFFSGIFLIDFLPGVFPMALLALSTFGWAVWASLYWCPFHVDFVKFTSKGKRGRQIGMFYAMQILLGVLAPILGGFIISTFSYAIAFIFTIAIVFLSLIPLAMLPETRVKYEFSFFETFKKFFSKRYRLLSVSMFTDGAEGIVGAIAWPIFLFTMFNGKYLDVGIFASVIVVISILLQLFIGKRLDERSPKKLLRWGIDLYSIGWVAKFFASSIMGVFAASTLHTFGSIIMRTPLDMMIYEKAADSGHYMDEFTVQRELGLTFGRAAMCALLIGITCFFSISIAFILAAVLSFGLNLFIKFRPQHR